MFTIDQIKAAHSKVKSGADFPNYIQDLKHLGVTLYDSYVHDGHTNYYGQNDYSITSDAKYPSKAINPQSNTAQFISQLKAHQQGHTDYPTFCNDCAENGVEKWRVDLQKMTCTYYDTAGHEMLVEQIPGVRMGV